MIGRPPHIFPLNHSTAQRKEWVKAQNMLVAASLAVDLIRVKATFPEWFTWEVQTAVFQWGLMCRDITLKNSGYGCYEEVCFFVDGPMIRAGFDQDPTDSRTPAKRVLTWILGEGVRQ